MATIDIILLALFVPGIIIGIAKGIITQIVSLLSVIVGAILASRFSPDLTQVAMLQFGTEEPVTHVVCFIAIFLISALVMALISVPSNYFIVYPFYYNFMPEETVLAAYQAILPSVKSILQALLVFNVPFTFIKGMLDVLVTMLIYKPLSPILKGYRHQ